MSDLSEHGESVVAEIAHRHGVSPGAVSHILHALQSGNGRQAQFSHPELGGMGQWSLGGMTMIGDMFNNALKARVDHLCSELSGLLRDQNLFAAPSSQSQSQGSGGMSGTGSSLFAQSSGGWPPELGQAASVGTQNNLRYAYFPATQRLAIDNNGQITVYDTADHQIGGFGQSQGGGQSLSFTSQHGVVNVSDLCIVPDASGRMPSPSNPAGETEATQSQARDGSAGASGPSAAMRPAESDPAEMADDQIFARIERLADLLAKGILTQSEFDTKKAELLARL